jgi:tellurite resistance protein TehA-like permease
MFGITGKLIGGLTFFFGLLCVVFSPYVMHKDFQPAALANAGILFGLVLMGVGLYLIFS